MSRARTPRARFLALISGTVTSAALLSAPAGAAEPAVADLAPLRNNVGIAQGLLSGANLDGDGRAFAAEALLLGGVQPGDTISVDGLDYTWPDTDPGVADNVEAAGQEITVTNAQGATTLGILAAAHHGDQLLNLTLVYATQDDDGNEILVEKPGRISIGDWWDNSGDDDDAISAPYHVQNDVPSVQQVGVPSDTVALDTDKTLVAVRLPNNGALHVFDMAIR